MTVSKPFRLHFMLLCKVFCNCIFLMFTVGCSQISILSPDAILPNGGVYHGDIKEGLFHGNGAITYPDGSRYTGEFAKGVYSGKGEYVLADGSNYTGDFLLGAASGITLYQSAKGDIEYRGEIVRWKFEGVGTLTNSESIYSGEFQGGSYHGQGQIKYQNGTNYVGEFKDGVFSGQGVYHYDETIYEGTFVDGELNGLGTIRDEDGGVYIGEVAAWLANGEGQKTDADGNLTIGAFESGYAHGSGHFVAIDGRQYEGNFKYSEFDGQGKLTLPDQSVYVGEFNYGRYYGEGELTTPAADGRPSSVKKGRWYNDKLVYNQLTGEYLADQAEIALEQHQLLLNAAIAKLEGGSSADINAYFLGVAGDGTQSVFRREIEFVSQQIDKRFDTEKRTINLINHHDSANIYPLATTRSFAAAVEGIANQMNKDNDVLFVYLSSHGSKEHALNLDHDSIDLPPMTAKSIGEVLNTSGIKWKVVFVSACYAGGFIPELDDGNTLIFAAADSDSTSFGCSEDSEMTYFGKALFNEVLANDAMISLTDAFSKAVKIIEKWESEQDLTASNPTIKKPATILSHLAKFPIKN